jgi:PEGA domain
MRALSLVLSVSLLSAGSPSALPQTPDKNSDKTAQADQPATQPIVKQPLAFGLEDATPVKLRINRTISSADAQVNDTVDFEVLEEVKIHDAVVIPRGGTAWGTVTEAQPKRRMGRGGKLDVNIDNVRLTSGEKVALRAVKDVKGGGHQGAMTGAIVASAIVFFPAAPLFLLVHGKDITIPKGTEITAYINGDIPLDPKKFVTALVANPDAGATTAQPPSEAPPAQNAGDSAALSTVEIKSTPDGADISVDDAFVGNTPATLKLGAGKHAIKVTMAGFKDWSRDITALAGSEAHLTANLDKSN